VKEKSFCRYESFISLVSSAGSLRIPVESLGTTGLLWTLKSVINTGGRYGLSFNSPGLKATIPARQLK
jgi:hypothetical protein